MTRDEIYRLARDAWLMDKHDCSDDWFVRADIDEDNIVEFAKLVAESEREACAKVCEAIYNDPNGNDGEDAYYTRPYLECAAAIRERVEK